MGKPEIQADAPVYLQESKYFKLVICSNFDVLFYENISAGTSKKTWDLKFKHIHIPSQHRRVVI